MSTKKSASANDMGAAASMGPSLLEEFTPDDTERFKQPLGLWLEQDGEATLVFKDGASEVEAADVPLLKGWNLIRPIGIKSGATVGKVFLGY